MDFETERAGWRDFGGTISKQRENMLRSVSAKILLALIIAARLISPVNVFAQEQGLFSEFRVENQFPKSLTFHVKVANTMGQIVSAEFVSYSESYYSKGSTSRADVEVPTGADLRLEYVMDTEDSTAVPMIPISYYWEVVDAQGVHYQSETMTIRYEDTRYTWKVKQNDQVEVWWHGRSDSFGTVVFDIANKALQRQRDLFQTGLDFPIVVLIYNSSAEFAEWHGIAHDWVGGESYSRYGITTQIIENANNTAWLEDVIPHEISHLYFEQVTHNPTVSIPVWLNEGVAQYNEFTENSWGLENVRSAAKNDDLISLTSLENGFGAFNEDRVRLAYDEALSAVTYLVDTFGENGLGDLLKSYKAGNPTEEAFISAFGVSPEEFEKGWAAWAGYEGEYAVPTARVMPTPLPPPTMFVPQSRGEGFTTQTAVARATDNPVSPTPVNNEPPDTSSKVPCASCLPAFGLGLGVLLQKRYRKKPKGQP
jgi:hypothetical protein